MNDKVEQLTNLVQVSCLFNSIKCNLRLCLTYTDAYKKMFVVQSIYLEIHSEVTLDNKLVVICNIKQKKGFSES